MFKCSVSTFTEVVIVVIVVVVLSVGLFFFFLRFRFRFVIFLLAADKVHKKAENINERRNANRDRALQQMEKLKDQLQLHQFLQVT